MQIAEAPEIEIEITESRWLPPSSRRPARSGRGSGGTGTRWGRFHIPDPQGPQGETDHKGVSDPQGPQGLTGAAGASSQAFPYEWKNNTESTNPANGFIKVEQYRRHHLQLHRSLRLSP